MEDILEKFILRGKAWFWVVGEEDGIYGRGVGMIF